MTELTRDTHAHTTAGHRRAEHRHAAMIERGPDGGRAPNIGEAQR
ncbi:hypothetical protein [Nocardia miyunensis]|nr:hypothetical protein [Nocardia miyunensis]